MGLNQFLQVVRCELQEILWKDVPRELVCEDWYRTEEHLRRASAQLAKLGIFLDELRSRLAEKERRARWLEKRVEVYLHVADQTNAWRHALELDGLRRTLDRERTRLQRQLQAYDAQRARVRRLQEQLDDPSSPMYFKR